MEDWQEVDISPPAPKQLNDPKHWREKAEEALTKAELMGDPDASLTMKRVAGEYEHLAELAEARAKSA